MGPESEAQNQNESQFHVHDHQGQHEHGHPHGPVHEFHQPAPVGVGLDAGTQPTNPVPVVRVLSPVGIEYVFMTISLFTGLFGLTVALLSLVNGKTDFSVLAFPVALLVTSVPVFAFLFLRLKKLELMQPALRFDASKRRSTQFTQIVSFIVCFFTVVGVIFSLFSKMGGESGPSIVKILLDALVILVVFGGTLYYYWNNEHRG